MKRLAVWAALLAGVFATTAQASGAASDGRRLAVVLDSLQVERHWPAGQHVDWRTGEPDGRPVGSEGRHTHCSAFVAAAAERLGVYILRPPEHGQVLLANAQADWLPDEGRDYGWRPVANGQVAQRDANLGYLVVASYRNHSDRRPGHIAIVRPSARTAAQIEADGPQVIQAGEQNYNSTSLRQGFAGHPSAWRDQEVRYYEHDLGRAGASSSGAKAISTRWRPSAPAP